MASSVAAGCNGTMQVYGFGLVLITGSFAPNAAAVSTTYAARGKGFSAAYTSTGTFTLTFTRSAISVLSCWLTMQHTAANVDFGLQFGDIDVVTALTAVIRNAPGGAVAALPAENANTRIHFGFLMATSSLNS